MLIPAPAWSEWASGHIHSYLAVVTVSCFVRVRVPRTKSEIEANAKRKELLRNFKIKLKNLKAAELDELDYRRGERGRERERKGGFAMLINLDHFSFIHSFSTGEAARGVQGRQRESGPVGGHFHHESLRRPARGQAQRGGLK